MILEFPGDTIKMQKLNRSWLWNKLYPKYRAELIPLLEILNYRTRAIITRGLYIFYPLFEGQKRFFKGLFS